MNRRAFLSSTAAAPLGFAALAAPPVKAAVPKSKITRVRVYAVTGDLPPFFAAPADFIASVSSPSRMLPG